MLYKKYHRSYVRKFKKGTKVSNRHNIYKDTVESEPYFNTEFHEVRVICNKYGWILVFPGGKLNKDVYAI